MPAALPVIEIPEFHFHKVAPLFSNLPEAKQTVDIQPMEQFNQGWGTILYRTTLPETTLAGTTLKITEVHDWAQIYADGKLLARLDRRKGEFTTTLPALKKAHNWIFLWKQWDVLTLTNPSTTAKESLKRWNLFRVTRLRN